MYSSLFIVVSHLSTYSMRLNEHREDITTDSKNVSQELSFLRRSHGLLLHLLLFLIPSPSWQHLETYLSFVIIMAVWILSYVLRRTVRPVIVLPLSARILPLVPCLK